MKKKTLTAVISMITILFIFSSMSYAATSDEWVNAHNKYRRMHIDTPDLKWDPGLAQSAQSCVNKGQTGWDQHCGDNQAIGGSSIQGTVDMWYKGYPPYVPNESELYKQETNNYTKPPNDANYTKWGHFTQVLWKSATKVGCAYNPNCNIKVNGKTYKGFWACNYDAGNTAGQYTQNVMPKKPQVDIKVNGLDHATVSSNTPVSIAFSLDTHGWTPYSDWWFIIGTAWGFYSFELGTGWVPGFSPLIQHSLFDISPPFKIFKDILPLPKGTYLIVIGVDKADGILNSFLCYDYAWITIK